MVQDFCVKEYFIVVVFYERISSYILVVVAVPLKLLWRSDVNLCLCSQKSLADRVQSWHLNVMTRGRGLCDPSAWLYTRHFTFTFIFMCAQGNQFKC